MSRRVVVFNHSEILLNLFHNCLQNSGYEPHSYPQSEMSLHLIERDQAEAVIVSYFSDRVTRLLPFLQELRANPDTADVPVLLCSAGTLTQDVAAMADVPGLTFFPYPFSALELPATMADLLPVSVPEPE